MIVSHGEAKVSRGALSLALTCLLATSALAQSEESPADQAPAAYSPPVSLLPSPDEIGTAPTGNSLVPAPGLTESTAATDPNSSDEATSATDPAADRPGGFTTVPPTTLPSKTKGSEIEVNRLGTIDLEAVGVLDSSNGGFGSDLWRDSKRHVVARFLSRLPNDFSSPTLRGLARRLLLSTATPPSGEKRGESDSLLRLRVERLVALGELEGLLRLLRVVPERHTDEGIQRARVESHLLLGDADSACTAVRNAVAQGRQSLYWQKALVFCQINAGEMDRAALGVGLLREQSNGEADGFIALAEAASAGLSDIPSLGDPSIFELSLLQRLDQPMARELAEESMPEQAFALAAGDKENLLERAELAEMAAITGRLPADKLGHIYQDFEFGAEDIAAAQRRAVEWQGPRSRALLYQAAVAAATPDVRAQLIRAAFEESESPQAYLVAVRLYEPLLLKLEPAPDLTWFAGDAGRSLFALGRFELAEEWMILARQDAMSNPGAAAAVTSLWPYARLAGLASVPWDGSLDAWISARSAEDPGELSQRVALLQIAMRALGGGGPLDWSEIAARAEEPASRVPDATVLFALNGASENGRLGESVLLALLVMGEEGPAGSHLMALEQVLRGLSNVGLEREARVLAIEAALAHGV